MRDRPRTDVGTRPVATRRWANVSRPARVAHSVEQLTRNEQVAGSIPASGSDSLPPLLVPAYFGPWEAASWQRLLAAVPTVIVINPASGPGECAHEGYRSVVARFAAIGTAVLGYVTTAYLEKSMEDCAAEAERYRAWYGVPGIFWDEVPAEHHRGRVARLRALHGIVADGGGCVFNPGRPVPRTWFGSLPDCVFVTFEGPARAHGFIDPVGPRDRQCHLVHSATASEAAVFPTGLGFGYVTSDLPPNPWDVFA